MFESFDKPLCKKDAARRLGCSVRQLDRKASAGLVRIENHAGSLRVTGFWNGDPKMAWLGGNCLGLTLFSEHDEWMLHPPGLLADDAVSAAWSKANEALRDLRMAYFRSILARGIEDED